MGAGAEAMTRWCNRHRSWRGGLPSADHGHYSNSNARGTPDRGHGTTGDALDPWRGTLPSADHDHFSNGNARGTPDRGHGTTGSCPGSMEGNVPPRITATSRTATPAGLWTEAMAPPGSALDPWRGALPSMVQADCSNSDARRPTGEGDHTTRECLGKLGAGAGSDTAGPQ